MRFFESIKQNFPKDWATRIILALVLVASLVGAYFAHNLVSRLLAGTTAFTLPGDPVVSTTEEPGEEAVPTSEPVINLPDPDPWDGTSRINILIMGLDLRDAEGEDAAPRSDTMILLTMDPLNNTAAAIAIPRDMWVGIPGYGYYKINTAYRLGELNDLPGGGPALAVQTVEEFLGVPIDFYAQVDFQAFVDFIDHINGIKITFDEPYTIDRRGKWNTEVLEPGTYVLDGEYTLAYARDRHSEGDDFDRSARQLDVIMKIRDRILEFNQLPSLVMNAPAIYEDLSTGIRTNMSLNQIIQLAWKAMDIPYENIQMVVIGPSYITIETSPDGLNILRPIPDKIRLLRDEVFGIGGLIAPVTEGDLASRVAAEAPTITVLNGSYQTGLEETTAEWLRQQGFVVLETGVGPTTAITEVTLQGYAPYGLSWIAETFGIAAGQRDYDFTNDRTQPDLILILGDDWAYSNPMP
ncbi:LCP family protein [Chloroflexota bacterium]|nr:LCP family protein [Chloroflexota bacterium]